LQKLKINKQHINLKCSRGSSYPDNALSLQPISISCYNLFNYLPVPFNSSWVTNFKIKRGEEKDHQMLRNGSVYYVPFALSIATAVQLLIYKNDQFQSVNHVCTMCVYCRESNLAISSSPVTNNNLQFIY
jgi:hypothetical protein